MNTLEKSGKLSFILYPLVIILVMWVVYWYANKLHIDLYVNGLYPHKFSGLQGVLFAPMLHGSFEHLVNNTLPVFMLSAGLYYFYPQIAGKVMLGSWTLPYLAIWFFARPAYHIGASTLVYALTAFLFFSGIWRQNRYLASLSLLVVFVYGSLVWGIFPSKEEISWEGHVAGGLVGIWLSWVFRKQGPPTTRYIWPEEAPLPDIEVIDYEEF